MAKVIVRYNVWFEVDRAGEDDLNAYQLDAIRAGLLGIPGFMEYSFEDSYDEED